MGKSNGRSEGEPAGKKNGVTTQGGAAAKGTAASKKTADAALAATDTPATAAAVSAGKSASSAPAKAREATAREATPRESAARAKASTQVMASPPIPTLAEEEPTGRAKFDLGAGAKGAERPVENIPWGYGIDRVTAMPVDPERLFVYWEVTDESIGRARASLGAAGGNAWLNLRVYDTTGRLFDGTNANSYFDHALTRDDRQWFFHIGRPHSTAFVDIGMKSAEGYFSRITRSGRVDFPRREPEREAEIEWLTVRVATGHVESAGKGAPAVAAPATAASPSPGPGAEWGGGPHNWFEPLPLWMMRQSQQGGQGQQRLTSWVEKEGGDGWQRLEWSEIVGEGWFGVEGRVEWQGPLSVTSWESGPFSYPVEVTEPVREEWQGGSFGYRRDGVMHMVYGPWQVVIRNLGAHYGRTVLSEWQVYRSWVVEAGHEVRGLGSPLVTEGAQLPQGASEALFAGASERRWQVGSELRLMGASERFRMGASEVRLGGASEKLMMGASERTLRGASERRFLGASAFAWGGASETILGGSSEKMYRGASERLGGSEGRLGGSEGRLGGSENWLAAEGEDMSHDASGRYPKVEG